MESSELTLIVVGILTSGIMGALKMLSLRFQKLPKRVKLIIVFVLAAPIAWLSGRVGIDLPADPTTWDGTTINAILIWLVAMGERAGVKALKPKVR
jgi:hypothetical protein